MTNQARKHSLGLAGEFLVAGELLRRGITAAVTYGNAKKADVVAIKDNQAASIEVKTTCESKWVVGNKVPNPSRELWIFVYLPRLDDLAPEFFVVTAKELNELLAPRDGAYRIRYFEKHGKEFEGTGVVSLLREEVQEHKGAWHKVQERLAITG
jgi:hypothetical protein